MYPSLSGDVPSISGSQDAYMSKNPIFLTESTVVLNFIREHRRPKISPLLPNPAYLPAYYQNLYHNTYVKKRDIPPKPNQIVEKITVQQSNKRKNQVDVSYPSTSPLKVLCDYYICSAKTKLLRSITKVDDEIAEIEFEIAKQRKKQQELEEAVKKPSVVQLKQTSKPVSYSLFQRIISENQRKAHEAHSILLNYGPELESPLYNQPSDTAVYHENEKSFLSFKGKLMMFLRKKCVKRVKTQKALLRLYTQLAEKWKNNVGKMENSRRHKSQEAKNRKYFETVFPELLKKKLTRERSKGDHVTTEADFQEILRRLQFENLEYTMLKSCSAHPPLLLDAERRSKFFLNQSNLITDVEKGNGEEDFFNLWTPSEKAIFKEKFIQCSKDFESIASFLDKKSVGDCVKYYYLTKKNENYKISRKSRKKQRVMVQPFRVTN